MVWGHPWWLTLSAGLFGFAPSVRSDPGNFVETKTALKAPMVNEIGSYCLESAVKGVWFLYWCDYRLGVNKSEYGSKYDMRPRIWIRMIGNPRLIHVNGDRWQRDQFESNDVKAKEGSWRAGNASYEKNCCSPKTLGQNTGMIRSSLSVRSPGTGNWLPMVPFRLR